MGEHCTRTVLIAVTLFITLLALSISTQAQTPLFTAQPPISVGTNPEGVVTADFNLDGNADVAVSNDGSSSITVLLGNGHGGYSAAPTISGNMLFPGPLAVGDFNNDGKPDLAVTNSGNNTVTIWLGNGDGTFTLGGSPIAVGSDPQGIVAGDFNRDGKVDLAVANNVSQTISILLGNGNGGFAPASPPTLSDTTQPYALAVADFNRDGKLDIVSVGALSNSLSVFLGNGDGTFEPSVSTAGFPADNGVAVADFNKDGIPDVAASSQIGYVSIFLGNGDGTFHAASGSPISSPGEPLGVVAGDFNRDGNPDFAVANYGSNAVSVFLGHGDGTFAAATGSPYAVGSSPYGLATGNFSGHGGLDLVVTNSGSGTITFLFNSTPTPTPTLTTLTSSPNPATFGTAVTFTATVTGAGGTPTGTVTFDDGTTSLGTATLNNGVAALTISTLIVGDHEISASYAGDSNFAASDSAPTTLQTGLEPYSVATADFNGDGLLDLAIVNYTGSTVSIFLNSVHGFPSAPTSTLALPGAGPQSVAVGDFNGDGKPDLALTMAALDQVVVALGNGDGTFTLSTPAAVGIFPTGVVAGDFNRDGKLDVAVTNLFDNTVSVLLGTGTGTFESTQTVSGSGITSPYSLITTDFNHDGKPDLAVDNGDATLSILLGDGLGGFTAASGSPIAGGLGFGVGDLSINGNQDIVVATVTGQVIVQLGNGAGGFAMAPGSPIVVGGYLYALAVGDFNGDGKPDLAATDYTANVLDILLGEGNGDFTLVSGAPPATGSGPRSVAVGDFNSDGKLDLATANAVDNTATVLLGYGNGQFQQILVQTITGSATADLSPPSLFGDQAVGTTSNPQLIPLTNNGSAPLAITSITVSGPFVNNASLTTCESTLAVGATCWIAVEFAPTAVGTATGTLSVATNAQGSPQMAALTGTGVAAAPMLTLSGPTLINNTLTFGSQVLGTTSPAQTVIVTNSGSATLTVSAVTVTTGFAIAADAGSCGTAPFDLDPDTSCNLYITFAPSATGTNNGTLSLTHNAAGSPAVVTLTGTGVSAGVSLTPSSTLAFGAQVVGTTSGPQTVTLTNTGSADLSVTAFAASGDFGVSSPDCATLPASLAPSAVCTFMVTFTPAVAGNRTGTMTITDSLGQQFVSLTGLGAAAGVQLTPANLDFGSQTVGTTSTEQTAILTNIGTSPLEVTGFIVAGDFAMTSPDCGTASEASPVVLAQDAVCTLEITFTPTAAGTRAGTVVVTTTTSPAGQFVVLEGIGNAPGLTLSPANLTFGSELVSTTSPSQIMTLTNSGTSSLTVNTFTASGDFAVTSPDCITLPVTLAPSTGVCTLVVSFTPVAAGERTGTLTVTSTASGGQAFAELEGFGEAPEVANLVLGPANLFFGSHAVGATSNPQVVVLTSNGTSAATVVAFAASGDFAVSSADCPTTPITLPPGKICTLSVTFIPRAVGNRTGTLTITSSPGDGQQFVPLAGNGIGPAPTVTPASLVFGTQVIGSTSPPQTVTLQNLGTASLTVTSFTVNGPFAVSSPNCPTVPVTLPATTGFCTLTVMFKPTVVGLQYGSLVITDNGANGQQVVSLAGYGGAPGTTVVPPNLTFGLQAVGTTSGTQEVTLTNTGTSTINITSVIATAEFTQTNTCGTSLAPGKSCTISVASSPTAAGPNAGALLVANDNGLAAVSLVGEGAGPNLSVTPSSLTFGGQNVGTTSAPQNVTLTNTGAATVTITAIIASVDFAQTNNCGASLAAGASCTISVTFTPTAVGSLNGTILVESSAGNQLVALIGTGNSTIPAVNLTPSSLSFGSIVVKTSAASQTVTLTNNTGATLQVNSVTASGDFTETNNCGKSVAPGAGCAITVGFTPSISGAHTGTLSVSDNASGIPQIVSLAGTGQDFGFGPFNLTQTIPPGVTTSYYLKLAPLGGFNQQVTLTCSGAPQNSTCTVDPSSTTLNGVNYATIVLRLATTAPSLSNPGQHRGLRVRPGLPGAGWKWEMLFALVLLLVANLVLLARRRASMTISAAVLALMLAWTACGGSSMAPHIPSGGTPAGSYVITVTAASGSLTHSLTVQLVVQ
ncbi:MAG TPA: choice-of-anchor D domain-containing protein [Terriglobales bacterium]